MDPTASFTISAHDETTAAIRSAAKNLHELERPIRDIRRLGEAVLGGFGFSKLLEGFDEVAKRAEKMGTDSAFAVVTAKKAVDELGNSLGDLAVDLVSKVAPGIETAAKFWKDWIGNNTGPDAQIRVLNDQILALKKSLDSMPKDPLGKTNLSNPFTQGAKGSQAQKDLDDLIAKRDALINAPDALKFDGEKLPLTKGLEGVNKILDDINLGFKELDRNEQLLDENALKITVPKTEQLRSMPLFDPNTKADLAEAKKQAKEFSDAMVATFESRGIQALLNGDLSGAVKGLAQDFAELVLKLAVLKPLAEQFSSWFASTGGLGSLFGSSSAGGDAGSAALAYTGLESASRAPAMQINNYVAAGLPPQWDQALGTAARISATQTYQALTNRQNGKR